MIPDKAVKNLKKTNKNNMGNTIHQCIILSAIIATLPVGTVESVIRKGTVVARAHMKKCSTTP